MIDLKRNLAPQSEWLYRRLGKDFETSKAQTQGLSGVLKDLGHWWPSRTDAEVDDVHAEYLRCMYMEKSRRLRRVFAVAALKYDGWKIAVFNQTYRPGIEAALRKRDVYLLPLCNTTRGAPMGRPEDVLDLEEPGSIKLFRVELDSGGYDNGSAYWGRGTPLFAAQQGKSYRFARANSREEAAQILEIPEECLKFKLSPKEVR